MINKTFGIKCCIRLEKENINQMKIENTKGVKGSVQSGILIT